MCGLDRERVLVEQRRRGDGTQVWRRRAAAGTQVWLGWIEVDLLLQIPNLKLQNLVVGPVGGCHVVGQAASVRIKKKKRESNGELGTHASFASHRREGRTSSAEVAAEAGGLG